MKYKLNIVFETDSMAEVTKVMQRVEDMTRSEDFSTFSLKSDKVLGKLKKIPAFKKKGAENG